MPRFNFTFQENSPLVSYTDGLWTVERQQEEDNSTEYDSNTTFIMTNSSGAKATFTFLGTGVSMFGALHENRSDFTVDVDYSGVPFAGNPNVSAVDLWHAYDLDNKEHTIQVTNEPTASGLYLDLDHISIEREIGQESDTIFESTIDDTSPIIHYHGAWDFNSTTQAQNHNGTIHTTTATGSHIMIAFRGCCIELYGLYANAAYTAGVDDDPPVAMRGLDVDLPSDMWYPQSLLYLKDGLSEDMMHTLTLTATDTDLSRPFSFDYAVIRSTNNATFTNLDKPQLSPKARLGLIVGLSSGCMLIAIIVIAYCLVRRRKMRKMADLAPRAYEIHTDRMPLLENSRLSSKQALDSQSLGLSNVSPATPVGNTVVTPERAVHSPPPAYDISWDNIKWWRR